MLSLDLPSSPELNDSVAVALGWPGGRQDLPFTGSSAFGGGFGAGFFAGLGLAIKFLGFRCGAADIAESEYFDFEVATIIADAQDISDAYFSRGLCKLIVRFDSAQVARLFG